MVIAEMTPDDSAPVRALLQVAFGGAAEAELVEVLVREANIVFAAIARDGPEPAGFIAFSRLMLEAAGGPFSAVALAPLAVAPERRRQGIGAALVGFAHEQLKARGEALSVVLGEPRYYRRFGYSTERAARFESPYRAECLLALAFTDAPRQGRLVYPPAFAAL